MYESYSQSDITDCSYADVKSPDIEFSSKSLFKFLETMYRFMILFSRQGKVRLQKWFHAIADKDRKKISRDIVNIVLQRRPKMSNFVDFMGHKIVYKRYASLYFCCAVDQDDNELEVLEVIHRLDCKF